MNNQTGILQYNIEDPQAVKEMRLALNASHLAIAVTEYDNALRAMSKYEGKETIGVDEARNLLNTLILEYYPGFYNDHT